MSSIKFSISVLALALLGAAHAGAVIFTNLYSFTPTSITNAASAGAYGGNRPQSALLYTAGALFGTTAFGGSNNDGVVFSIEDQNLPTGPDDNTPVTNLYTFQGPDGAHPEADLVESGATLFGTTAGGGAYGAGTVFALNANGSGFTNLFNFAFTNGGNPQAGLVFAGGRLYGSTSEGGTYGAGTIFAVSTNGTGFTNLLNFNYTNGANPGADLLLIGNTLYGTTQYGGSNGLGTLFAINTNGAGFTDIFNFARTNGANPQAGLALVSNVLCGTTLNGGVNNQGTVFLIATNGNGFNVLYNFGASSTDGYYPYSRLVVVSNGASSYSLYGTTEYGGQGNYSPISGTVFGLNVSGPGLALSSYSILSSFTLSIGQGAPMAGLVLDNNALLGTTTVNHNYGNGGGVFCCYIGGSCDSFHQFEGPNDYASTNRDGANPLSGLIVSGRTLYGTAASGGTNGCGSIFAVNTDGTGFRLLGTPENGPWAGMDLSGSTLYGITSGYISYFALDTSEGYGSGSSVIFSVNTDGSDFTNLASGYSNVQGGLALSGNMLYGTTAQGGSQEAGTIFAVTTGGTNSTTLYNFNYATGATPVGGPILSADTLYGTTQSGGSPGYGTVYAVNTNGSNFADVFDFSGTNGSEPVASLVLSGNTLYGVTESDTTRGFGTVFAVNTDGTGFTNLYSFSGYDGVWPQANLILCGDTLYGTTKAGGSGGYGTVFSIKTNGTDFTTLYNFSGGNDGANPCGPLALSGNTLYGTTSIGGYGGCGTVFALSLGPIPLNVTPDGFEDVLTWGNPAFSLQSAPAINGPYTTIPGATSPYTNAVMAAQQFFRLQVSSE